MNGYDFGGFLIRHGNSLPGYVFGRANPVFAAFSVANSQSYNESFFSRRPKNASPGQPAGHALMVLSAFGADGRVGDAAKRPKAPEKARADVVARIRPA